MAHAPFIAKALLPFEISPRCKIGSCVEHWVAARYQSQGWEILAQNYRRRGTELDFIAWKHGTVAVVEVKARRNLPPLSGIIETLLPRKKQAALQRGVLLFLQEQGEKLSWRQARLDLVVVALPLTPPIRVLFFPDVKEMGGGSPSLKET